MGRRIGLLLFGSVGILLSLFCSQSARAQSVFVDLTSASGGGCYCYDGATTYVAKSGTQTLARFSGGRIFTCQGGQWSGKGYTTVHKSNDSAGICYPGFTNPMNVTFPRPVYNVTMHVSGTAPQTIVITDSKGFRTTVSLAPTNPLYGYASVSLSGRNITSLSLQSSNIELAAGYDRNFAIQDIGFYWSAPLSPPPAPPGNCGQNAIARQGPQFIRSLWPENNWSMQAEVTDNDGLVLRDVKLNDRYLAKLISVPYFNLQTNAFPNQRGELKPNGADPSLRSRLINYYVVSNDPLKLVIEATYAIDRIPASSGSCLHMNQRYEFYKRIIGDTCEPSGDLPCSRFKPVVKYTFFGSGGETLTSINVAQRHHFQIDGNAKNTIGLFRDPNKIFFAVLNIDGFTRLENPLLHEHRALIIKGGQSTDEWDNIHQTYESEVAQPYPTSLDLSRINPGCYECLHNHWRWGTFLNGEGNGKLIGLSAWSRQDAEIGVVLHKNGEEHPSSFKDLVDPSELIRTVFPVLFGPGDPAQIPPVRTAPLEVVRWHSAIGYDAQDYFFATGGFFNPAIQSKTLHSAALQDGLSSVVATNIFEDGTTTVTGFDPAQAGPLPTGYTLYNNLNYSIETAAKAAGPYVFTIKAGSVPDQTAFGKLRVLHAEFDPFDPDKVLWADRTILSPDPQAPDFASKTVTARASSLGAIILASLAEPASSDAADLSIAGTASPDPLVAGANLTYTFNVTNNGPQTVTNTSFAADLPPNLVFVSATAGQGSCKEKDGSVFCSLGSLAVGSTASITIIGKPSESSNGYPPEGRPIATVAFVRCDQQDTNQSNNAVTVSTTVLPDPNRGPTASITSPQAGALFVGPATISIIANATDPDGAIAKVDFYDNGELIGGGTDTGSGEYTLNVSSMPMGNHSFVAVATDNLGKSAVSGPVNVVVNGPATVTITGPSDNSQFNRPATITASASASISSGTVSKVDFYANGLLLGTAGLTGPDQYSFTWSNLVDGSHVLTAVATDSTGTTTVSRSVRVTVNDSPGVSILNPAAGAGFTFPAIINLTAAAGDGDGYVTRVDFYANGSVIASNSTANAIQHSASWAYAAPGAYSITAVATDNSGATATSAPINVTINPAPAVGSALLVVGNTTLNAIDNDIKTRLANLGLAVTVKSASAAVTSDATGKRVVVVSETVSPTSVNTKFRTVAAPVVMMEPLLFDDMGMTGLTSGADYGSTSSQTQVAITDASDSLTAGLSGNVTVVSAASKLAWGIPNANAVTTASLVTSLSKATIFRYETGAAMPGLSAPGRRVGFFLFGNSASLTSNGASLFYAAVKWSADL